MYESNKKYMYVKHLNNWKTNFPKSLILSQIFPPAQGISAQHLIIYRVEIKSSPSVAWTSKQHVWAKRWDLYYPRLTIWPNTVLDWN